MMENDENRRNAGEGAAGPSNPKSESSPNDEVRKYCDREKPDDGDSSRINLRKSALLSLEILFFYEDF